MSSRKSPASFPSSVRSWHTGQATNPRIAHILPIAYDATIIKKSVRLKCKYMQRNTHMEVTLKRCMFLRPMLPSAEQPRLRMFRQIAPTCPAEPGKRRNECRDEFEIFHFHRTRCGEQKYALILALACHPTAARARSHIESASHLDTQGRRGQVSTLTRSHRASQLWFDTGGTLWCCSRSSLPSRNHRATFSTHCTPRVCVHLPDCTRNRIHDVPRNSR